MALVEDEHAVEIGPEPVGDLAHARGLGAARVGAQGGVGGEQDPLRESDGAALGEARQRRDQQPLLAEGRPVAAGILDQGVGLRDPDGPAAALQPVVEQDAGDLAALAGAGTVTEHEAAAEPHGTLGFLGDRLQPVEGVVGAPSSGEDAGMGLAGVDQRLELRFGEQAGLDEARRQQRLVSGLGRSDRGHGGGLNQRRRMRPGAGDAQDLQGIGLVERLAERATGLWGRPVASRVGERNADGRCWVRCTQRDWHGGRRGARRALRRARGPEGWRFGIGGHDRQPGWQALLHPGEQRRGVRRLAGRDREDVGIGRGSVIDDGETSGDRGAVAGIDAPVDRSREHHPRRLLQLTEGRTPGRSLRREGRAGDGDEATADRQAREGGGQVTPRGIRDPASTAALTEKGGFIRTTLGRQAGSRRSSIWAASKRVTVAAGNRRPSRLARVRAKLVEHEPGPGHLGEDGEQAGAGGGFEHGVGRGERRSRRGDETERQWRRELLQGLALVGAPGLGRQQGGHAGEHGEARGRISCLQRWCEATQEEQLGGFSGLVGVLPAPGTRGIGAAKGPPP